MRYVTVPEDISLKDLISRKETGQKYAFFTWLQEIVLMDSRFSVSWKTNRSAVKVSDAFFGKKAGDVVALEDADYDLVKEAVEEPTRLDRKSGQVLRGYEQPALFQQVGPFVEAILEAKDKE